MSDDGVEFCLPDGILTTASGSDGSGPEQHEIPPETYLQVALEKGREAYDACVVALSEVPEGLKGFMHRGAREAHAERAEEDRKQAAALMGAIEVLVGNFAGGAAVVQGIGEGPIDDPYQFALYRQGKTESLRHILDSIPQLSNEDAKKTLLELASLGNLYAIQLADDLLDPAEMHELVDACLKAGAASEAKRLMHQAVVSFEKARTNTDKADMNLGEIDSLLMCFVHAIVRNGGFTGTSGDDQVPFFELLKFSGEVDWQRENRDGDVQARRLHSKSLVELLDVLLSFDAVPAQFARTRDFLARWPESNPEPDFYYYNVVAKAGGRVVPLLYAEFTKLGDDQRYGAYGLAMVRRAAEQGEYGIAADCLSVLTDPMMRLTASHVILREAFDNGLRITAEDVTPNNEQVGQVGAAVLAMPGASEFDATPDDVLLAKIYAHLEMARLDTSQDIEAALARVNSITNPYHREKAMAAIEAKRTELEMERLQ